MIEIVKLYVKSRLDLESTGHDYMHALRVYKNAELLLHGGIDKNLVLVAALTHDLIDTKVTNEPEKELTLLMEFLEDKYDKYFSEKVASIITSISYRSGKVPESPEGKIVQDADRLEALGAIGIARTFAYGGKHNRNIYHPEKDNDSVSHFYDKLFKLSDLMNTVEAKKIAVERTDYMRKFLDQLYLEIK